MSDFIVLCGVASMLFFVFLICRCIFDDDNVDEKHLFKNEKEYKEYSVTDCINLTTYTANVKEFIKYTFYEVTLKVFKTDTNKFLIVLNDDGFIVARVAENEQQLSNLLCELFPFHSCSDIHYCGASCQEYMRAKLCSSGVIKGNSVSV